MHLYSHAILTTIWKNTNLCTTLICNPLRPGSSKYEIQLPERVPKTDINGNEIKPTVLTKGSNTYVRRGQKCVKISDIRS